ncbi:MAG: hypothetical protein ACT4TC_12735 [Myxococcaceae bacterium]
MANISNTFVSGQYNVWIPPQYASNISATNGAPLTNGAFLTFSSLQQAQADVQTKGVGVIMDPSGQVDPNVQAWAGWSTFQSSLPTGAVVLNPTTPGTTNPTASSPPAPVALPVMGKFSVFLPVNWVTNQSQFPRGSFTVFDTQQAAETYAKSSMGLVLDTAGNPLPTQSWTTGLQYLGQALNHRLSAQPTANEYNVWFPGQYGTSLGVASSLISSYAQGGAYLSFKTAAEAQAHVKTRSLGVILDPSGKLDATQIWPTASRFAPQLLNGQLTPQPTSGKFHVWFPSQLVRNLGMGHVPALQNSAYLAFNTQQEAIDHAKLRGFGVVLDVSGAPIASQPWNQAGQYISQLQNNRISTSPTANKFNVWIPANYMGSVGLTDMTKFTTPNGYYRSGYLSFDTEQEAQAFVQQRTFGVVLDTAGKLAATQPWSSANQFGAQLENVRLTTSATANKFNVWVPGAYAYNLGVDDPTPYENSGAFLSFDTEQAARDHAKQRTFGVVLDPNGKATATQPWSQAMSFVLQLTNAQLVTQAPANKPSVWFPGNYLTSIGINNPAAFPNGAYLPLSTVQEAIDHAKARGMGVVLDSQGKPDATQPWSYAKTAILQLTNAQLTPSITANKYNVWFPQQWLSTIGVTDYTKFPLGAYLPFNSLQEAQDHVTQRAVGVIYDTAGKYDVNGQKWDQAATYGPPPALTWPPPTPTNPDQPYSGGVADILKIYGQAKQGGCQIAIRTHGMQMNETMQYELFANVGGSEMKIKNLGSSSMAPTGYVHDAIFDLDYTELSNTLSLIAPGTTVGPDTPLAVRVAWPASGHDQGVNSGGAGNHRFIAA